MIVALSFPVVLSVFKFFIVLFHRLCLLLDQIITGIPVVLRYDVLQAFLNLEIVLVRLKPVWLSG